MAVGSVDNGSLQADSSLTASGFLLFCIDQLDQVKSCNDCHDSSI